MQYSIINKILSLGLIFSISSSFAKPNDLQNQVLSDFQTMKPMSASERKAYRKSVFSNMSRDQRLEYNHTFKQMRKRPIENLTSEKTALRLPGSNITYDTGASLGDDPGNPPGQFLGNRFDNALNPAGTAIFPVETTGSITMITYQLALASGFSSAQYEVYSNIMGTSAMRIASDSVNLAGGIQNITLMTPVTVMGSFIAGIVRNSTVTSFTTMSTNTFTNTFTNTITTPTSMGGPTTITTMSTTMSTTTTTTTFTSTSSTALAVDAATVGGQGFHGVRLSPGATAMGISTIADRNAIFRVSGNVSTPVELMNFTVE